jgi:hypothetical protein
LFAFKGGVKIYNRVFCWTFSDSNYILQFVQKVNFDPIKHVSANESSAERLLCPAKVSSPQNFIVNTA